MPSWAMVPHACRQVNAVNMGWTVTDNEMALQSAQVRDGETQLMNDMHWQPPDA